MSKEVLHNAAYSVQLPYIAGLSLLYKFLQNKMFLENKRGEFNYNSFQLVRLDVLRYNQLFGILNTAEKNYIQILDSIHR